MLLQPTIQNLKTMRLHGMVKALEAQMNMPDIEAMSFFERLGLLVDHELTYREDRSLQSRLRKAKLRQAAMIEDLDLKTQRGLDRNVIAFLSTSEWVHKHQNVLLIGKTGVGKSFVACALAQKACRDGFTALYERAPRLFEELAIARIDGRHSKLLDSLSRKDLLIIDDFGLAPLTSDQRRDLLEILEDRYDRRSTMITSQLSTDHWHEIIGEPTIADAIMDRLVHNAHLLKLKGESMRDPKNKSKS